MRKFLVILVVVATVAGGAWVLRPEPVSREVPFTQVNPTLPELRAVAGARVFFAHQSVGQNILEILPQVYSDRALSSPLITTDVSKLPNQGGFISHIEIGTNGDPLGKISQYEEMLRGGLADKIDVALLKLCFVDFNAATDSTAVFEAYRAALARLSEDFPRVRFIYATAPLMADRDLYLRLKALLGRGQEYDPSHNAARERFNALMRAEYGSSGRLFDVAAIESAGTSGTLRFRTSDAGEFLAMDPALTSDGGHLNSYGATLATNGWIAVVAGAIAEK